MSEDENNKKIEIQAAGWNTDFNIEQFQNAFSKIDYSAINNINLASSAIKQMSKIQNQNLFANLAPQSAVINNFSKISRQIVLINVSRFDKLAKQAAFIPSMLNPPQPTRIMQAITNSMNTLKTSLDYSNNLFLGIGPSIEKLHQNALKARPRLAHMSAMLRQNGWGISPTMATTDLFNIMDNDLDVDEEMVSLYEQNNFDYLYGDLESLASDLPDELAEIPRMISSTFKNQRTNYKLAFTNLFAVIDYLFVRDSGHEITKNSGYIAGYRKIRDFRATMQKDDSGETYRIFTIDTLAVVQELFRNIDNMNQPFARVPYRRHSIDHGRYDYRKLTKLDFYKLVNVCASYAMLSN